MEKHIVKRPVILSLRKNVLPLNITEESRHKRVYYEEVAKPRRQTRLRLDINEPTSTSEADVKVVILQKKRRWCRKLKIQEDPQKTEKFRKLYLEIAKNETAKILLQKQTRNVDALSKTNLAIFSSTATTTCLSTATTSSSTTTIPIISTTSSAISSSLPQPFTNSRTVPAFDTFKGTRMSSGIYNQIFGGQKEFCTPQSTNPGRTSFVPSTSCVPREFIETSTTTSTTTTVVCATTSTTPTNMSRATSSTNILIEDQFFLNSLEPSINEVWSNELFSLYMQNF